MKRFTAIFAMLAIVAVSFGQVAGEYFAPVGWGSSPSDVDWDADPFAKSEVTIKMANDNHASGLDIDDFTATQLVSFWDRLGDENLITNAQSDGDDAASLDAIENLDGDATFGASWKAFYNDDALYVILKFVDTDGIATARWFEVMLQTADPVRYEAGWQAAVAAEAGLEAQNDQYGRFIELGGMKIRWQDGGSGYAIDENVASVGADGAWGSHPIGTDIGGLATIDGGSGDLWFILELPFDELTFYSDPWDDGTATGTDPTVQETISWDVSPRATHTSLAGTYRGFWNSTENNVYKYVYYAGLLTFGTEVFDPVGFETSTVSDKAVYVYDDVLRLRGFEKSVDVDIYSIIGQKVMSVDNVDKELNVSNLNNGVYVVKVNGEKEAFKVLK